MGFIIFVIYVRVIFPQGLAYSPKVEGILLPYDMVDLYYESSLNLSFGANS